LSSAGPESQRRRFVSPAAQERLLALGDRAVAERVPLSGSLAMTHRCHLRCVHCYLGDERFAPPEEGECDTGFWLSVVDQLADAGCLNLLFTGGEPLLRPDLPAVYERAIRRGILLGLFTNGILVDDRILGLFAECPPQLIEITLYGASAEVYERVTGVAGSFTRCLHGIDALLERGQTVALKAMILRENQHEIEAMRELARARDLEFRVDPALFPRFDGDPAPLAHRIPADEAIAIEMRNEDLARRTAEYFTRKRDVRDEKRLFGCLAGVTGFHIDPRGTLLPCLMVSTHGFDLRQGTFRRGWDEVLPAFHEQGIVAGYECNVCELRNLCGVCPAQTALETGSHFCKADYTCRLGEARRAAIADRVDSEPTSDLP